MIGVWLVDDLSLFCPSFHPPTFFFFVRFPFRSRIYPNHGGGALKRGRGPFWVESNRPLFLCPLPTARHDASSCSLIQAGNAGGGKKERGENEPFPPIPPPILAYNGSDVLNSYRARHQACEKKQGNRKKAEKAEKILDRPRSGPKLSPILRLVVHFYRLGAINWAQDHLRRGRGKEKEGKDLLVPPPPEGRQGAATRPGGFAVGAGGRSHNAILEEADSGRMYRLPMPAPCLGTTTATRSGRKTPQCDG